MRAETEFAGTVFIIYCIYTVYAYTIHENKLICPDREGAEMREQNSTVEKRKEQCESNE